MIFPLHEIEIGRQRLTITTPICAYPKEKHSRSAKSSDLRSHADKALGPIKHKLKGFGSYDKHRENREMSVVNQVDALIKEATSDENLVSWVCGVMVRVMVVDVRGVAYVFLWRCVFFLGSDVWRLGGLVVDHTILRSEH